MNELKQLKKDLEESISTANSLDESLIKACSRADRYRIALQSIVEHKFSMDVEKYNEIFDIATEALSDDVKVEHEGHLYVFGEDTIQISSLHNVNPFPFKRIKGDK